MMLPEEITSYHSRIMLHLDHACQISINTFIDNAEDLDIVTQIYNIP